MPFEKGHQINKGNHNVGRKSTRDEHAKNQAIKKAWEKVNDNVETEKVEKIALPLALRDMTDKQEYSGEISVVLNISKDVADKNGITPKTIPNSEGQS